MKLYLVLLITILFAVSCKNNNNADNSEELKKVNEIDSLFKHHNSKEFFSKATAYTYEYPQGYAGWSALGSYYLYFGNNDSLAEYYTRKSLLIKPDGYSSLQNMGLIYHKRKEYDSADVYYQKSILAKPNYGVAYSNCAGNRYQMGDYTGAVKYAEIAVQLEGDTLDQAELAVYYGKCNRKNKVDSMLKVLANEKFSRIDKIKALIGDTSERN